MRSPRPTVVPTILFVAAACLALLTSACSRSDESVQASVQEQLAADPATKDAQLTVAVKEGVAHISGETATMAQQARAMDIARSVKGVQLVESGMWVTDATLVRDVQQAVAADPEVSQIPLKIEANHGEVRLFSDQTNADQRAKLVSVARGVDGVTHVEDHMK
jgi:osmotically-inducible protein OsmY